MQSYGRLTLASEYVYGYNHPESMWESADASGYAASRDTKMSYLCVDTKAITRLRRRRHVEGLSRAAVEALPTS